MDDLPHRLLLHGFDTLQCAYYLHAKEDGIFDCRELAVNKEALQHRKSKRINSVQTPLDPKRPPDPEGRAAVSYLGKDDFP